MRLIVMRHAKSGWDDPLMNDHARPLNARGRADAVAMGAWLRARAYLPDRVLCSTAQRTRETLDLLALGGNVIFDDGLYHASDTAILSMIGRARDVSNAGETVLIVGHNPGIGSFASRIVAATPAHARFGDYPTCATLVATLPADATTAARFGCATALDFIVPRDLR